MRDAIIASATNRTLLDWLSSAIVSSQVDSIQSIYDEVITLDEGGEIDALQALLDSANDWTWRADTQTKQNILTVLLPLLDVPVLEMISAIKAFKVPHYQHIVTQALYEWCSVDTRRVVSTLSILQDGVSVPEDILSIILINGARNGPELILNDLISMAVGRRSGSPAVAIRAIGHVGKVEHSDFLRIHETLSAIYRDSTSKSEKASDAVVAALALAQGAPEPSASLFENFCREICGTDDAGIINALLQSFVSRISKLTPALADCLFAAILKVSDAESAAFDHVDLCLSQMLCSGAEEVRIIRVLSDLLQRSDGEAVFKRLNSTIHYLSSEDRGRLNRLVTAWLLEGKSAVCRGLHLLIMGLQGHSLTLSFESAEATLTDAKALYFARKAVGWLIIYPVAAASLLVSLMGVVGEPTRRTIALLLFEPMLTCFPATVGGYLRQVSPSLHPDLSEAVQESLSLHDAYRNELLNGSALPELHPSERERAINFEFENERFTEAFKRAQEGSVLHSLVSKSILLFGTEIVSHHAAPDGTFKRIASKLGRISSEQEHAMQWVFDPVGFEFLLWRFRVEGAPD